ncbi:hypothetical protein [Streptomyces sp. NPDC055962]|uniref:hypothetical protein n=1 Tax=unclassified Streptomyces TaxID=2593676 RepID=UPI0035D674FE
MDPTDILLALAAGSLANVVVRLAGTWVRARHPKRATVTIGNKRLKLDLSNPNEAERYLKSTPHGPEDR